MPANALTRASVVPAYMREDVLPRCRSLGAAQTRPPLEIIVVELGPRMEEADSGRSIVGSTRRMSRQGASTPIFVWFQRDISRAKSTTSAASQNAGIGRCGRRFMKPATSY